MNEYVKRFFFFFGSPDHFKLNGCHFLNTFIMVCMKIEGFAGIKRIVKLGQTMCILENNKYTISLI